ncbi:MAG: ABC transporter ATP-binding protein [Acidimicrobiia bacterium]|nr:ABC transporter ATP-binding protein [Acidimicrobiia bacterium]
MTEDAIYGQRITLGEPPLKAGEVLYSLRDVSVEYGTRAGPVAAVDRVSLDIRKGEILGLVGESGCGKSTLGKAMLRMITRPGKITTGELWFDGVDLLTLSERRMREIRGARLGMVFQDPMTSLNPLSKIVDHLTETVMTHEPNVSEAAARDHAAQLIGRLGLREERIDDYPHQFSGGMRQRIMIALALALQADLVIADEPTTALDVIVEAQFLDLLRELRDEFDLTIVLITHNIGVVAEVADRVAVMYAGRMAELASVNDLFLDTKHPYGQGLLRAVPNIELDGAELYQMAGAPPNLLHTPSGCAFHPRCPAVMPICSQRQPEFLPLEGDHYTACWLYQDHPAKPGGHDA